jgi:tetratricopeptide (TPR) repeat protein
LAAFIKHWEGGKLVWFAVSQLLFLASLFTKETAVVFPLIGLAYVLFLGKSGLNPKRVIALNITGWALCVLLWYLMREQALILSNAWRGFKLFTLAEAAKGLLSYLGKLGLPFSLSVLPDIRNISWPKGAAIVVLAAGSMIWLGLKNKRLAAFGFIWTVLFLLPVIIVVPGPKTFLEHRMYLPFMGILMIVLSLALEKLSMLISRGLLIFLLMIFSAGSFVHSRSFKNDMVFWQNAAVTSPDSDIARNGLGKAHYQRGQLAEAGQQFRLALEQEPENPVYLYNTAALYLTRENIDSADICITKELSLYPGYPKANFIKAQICQAKGQLSDAEQHYHKEIVNNPRYLKSYIGLAHLYLGQNKNGQARDVVLKALQQYPQDEALRQMLSVIP